ncbi:PepSY-associated TM helix domain-containing protein [Phenylobacterium deserti]|uniref:PepSY domain-containing protein n=1 Tax=Phenylobacterium deserti TaxID=1914756 RepID=A0A328ASC1_9CAUL|nr:PepSY-associated TM helix domain-containing protein [Phenylobacterium deserti]RAK57963.1 PepSY domain-containing protein [Phenylobacterium deserti]
MRGVLVATHRWLGLATAAFLFIAGLTGAIISWDHEVDSLINPAFYKSSTAGAPMTPLALAEKVEREHPELQVTFMPLAVEPGHSVVFSVEPKPGPDGKGKPLGYNQLALDPVTGAELARRQWGAVSLSRENIMPFLYKLHYSLTLPFVAGVDIGVLLMGLIGIAWAIDCFVALWISFPSLAAWKKSFAFRWRQGGYRLMFDYHRSGGVWLWALLLTLAVTSVSMNLGTQVVRPIVSMFSPLSADVFSERTPRAFDEPSVGGLPRQQVIEIAVAEGARRGFSDPAGGLFYSPMYDVYGVGFYEPGNDHGDGGLGNAWLYFDGRTGAPASAHIPGKGTAGDIFLQAQFPIHSGRIIGVPGRILVSILGAAVAAFSVTGIIIWAKKRRGRVLQRKRARAAAPTPARSPVPAPAE